MIINFRLTAREIPPILILLLASLASSSCSFLPNGRATSSDPGAVQIGLVARDLLYVMTQIIPPNSTTIQMGKSSSTFGKELDNGFRELGYGIQRVSADQGPNHMNFSQTRRLTSGNQETRAYTVYVGDIGLKREYVFVPPAGVAPISPLLVFGTNKAVSLSEDLFPARSAESESVAIVEYSSSSEFAVSVPKITLISEELKKDTLDEPGVQLPNYTSLNSQNILIENLFTKGSSNFEDATRDYRIVHKDVIAFGNDSLRLLRYGKSQIERILRVYNPETDSIRLIGCSNGPTSYKGGNEGLALGRSKRVAQELLNSGVNESNILDEGCWAPVSANDRFPARGVVIELRRKG